MAGSINHCLSKPGDDNFGDITEYRGSRLLENMRDMIEGVEEMMFVIGALSNGYTSPQYKDAYERYYRCVRGEASWPAWFVNGVGK